MKTAALLSALALALGGCASIAPVHMALGEDLAAAPAQPFTGAGFGRSGSFQLAGHKVAFRRSADRVALADPLYQISRSRVRLTIDGPDLSAPLQVDCGARQRTATLSFFSTEIEPMAFGCSFQSDGRSIPARFEVQAVRPTVLVARHERRGEIALDRVILQVRSVHQIVGARVGTDLPIGYVFERDGRAVAAVEMNGVPVLRLASAGDVAERRAAIVGAVALGLLWDPSADD